MKRPKLEGVAMKGWTRLVGVIMALVGGFATFHTLQEAWRFNEQAVDLKGRVESISWDSGSRIARVVFKTPQGERATKNFEVAKKGSGGTIMVGDPFPLRYNETTGKVRKGGFLAFYFQPLIYGAVFLLGAVFVFAPKGLGHKSRKSG